MIVGKPQKCESRAHLRRGDTKALSASCLRHGLRETRPGAGRCRGGKLDDYWRRGPGRRGASCSAQQRSAGAVRVRAHCAHSPAIPVRLSQGEPEAAGLEGGRFRDAKDGQLVQGIGDRAGGPRLHLDLLLRDADAGVGAQVVLGQLLEAATQGGLERACLAVRSCTTGWLACPSAPARESMLGAIRLPVKHKRSFTNAQHAYPPQHSPWFYELCA
jgi:hypothetical protein